MRRPFYHLTRDDREVILGGIVNAIPLSDIAITLGKDPTSISREVKTHRISDGRAVARKTNICIHASECMRTGLCGAAHCKRICSHCLSRHCFDVCDDFIEEVCKRTSRWPYVCNGCSEKGCCGLARFSYHPGIADASADRLKRESRSQISVSKEELLAIDEIISPLLKDNKHSVEVIYQTHKDRIPVSAPTLRRYIDDGRLRAIRLDLLSAPARAPRRQKRDASSRHADDGRSYADFAALDLDTQCASWELDTVHGSVRDRSCLMTLLNRASLFMFIFKIAACNVESVQGIFDYLEILCNGAGVSFQDVFNVILTDNGPEFSNPEALEASCLDGGLRCRLFYCDPYCSSQKPYIEGRHTLVRRVWPKGQPIDALNHSQIATLASHLNSYPAPTRGGRTPYEMTAEEIPSDLLKELGIRVVPVSEVKLARTLLTN